VFPYIGNRPIVEVSAPEVLALARRIVDRGAVETAHRALQNISQVMRYAVVTGRVGSDPTSALRGALPAAKSTHHAAITGPRELGGLLRAISKYKGTLTVHCALLLSPYVFVRPRELRHAEWAEIDFDDADGALWSIPAEKMKGGQSHLVPLAWQSEAILHELEPLPGRSQYVFPSARSSTNAR